MRSYLIEAVAVFALFGAFIHCAIEAEAGEVDVRRHPAVQACSTDTECEVAYCMARRLQYHARVAEREARSILNECVRSAERKALRGKSK